MIKTLLKIGFAAGIIYWMVQKGDLDFNVIPQSFAYKWEWFVLLSLVFTNVILTGYRWKMLVGIKSEKKLPFLPVIKLTWIGLFFSCVLPGIVTGDVIKLVYARDLDKNLSKTYMFTSIFMDRVIGLMGLLFLLGFFSIIRYTELTSISDQLTKLIHFNFLIFAGVLTFLIYVFLPTKYQALITKITDKIPAIGHKISDTLKQVWIIGSDKKTFSLALLLSILVQTLNVFAFWYIGRPFFDAEIGLEMAYTFIPIGLTAIAIPISPAGLGVGHAAFGKLFSFYGVSTGASVFNLYFIGWLLINLLGAFPYIFSGKRHSLKEAEELEHEGDTCQI